MAANGTAAEKAYILKVQSQGETVHEDCLVDTWVSQERLAFIDLQAGPFHWGPAIVGEGVRTLDSIPEAPHASEVSPFAEQHELHDNPEAHLPGPFDVQINNLAVHWRERCKTVKDRSTASCLGSYPTCAFAPVLIQARCGYQSWRWRWHVH